MDDLFGNVPEYNMTEDRDHKGTQPRAQQSPSKQSPSEKSPSEPPPPLAEQMRPHDLRGVYGQDHLLGPDAAITKMIERGHIPSFILWGPPGCGKTTIAKIIAQQSGLRFQQISAIFSGVGDLRSIFDQAKISRQNGKKTLLFVDEIHRFNKSQQDAFLPVVEDGTITLIGATTENPSFELNAALLSRCQVYTLKALDDAALNAIIDAAQDKIVTQYGAPLPIDNHGRATIIALADGDGRYLLNIIQQIGDVVFASPQNTSAPISADDITQIIQKRRPIYDKNNDGHYNLISALHKSVRGSDPDAALYWFCRMLNAGEDPNFLARRIVRMASEDICLADPNALTFCLSAWQAYERLGSPEGELALTNAVIYLASAPKSNAAYMAYKSAMTMAKKSGSSMPPAHILNAPTNLMKDQGYGDGYIYDHDTPNGFSGQDYFPDTITPRPRFYSPVERGFEREIKKRLTYWQKLRDETMG